MLGINVAFFQRKNQKLETFLKQVWILGAFYLDYTKRWELFGGCFLGFVCFLKIMKSLNLVHVLTRLLHELLKIVITMCLFFFNFVNALNVDVSRGNEFFSLVNSGLSCPCFGWSFIGVPKYCLSFSSEFMKKKHCLHND